MGNPIYFGEKTGKNLYPYERLWDESDTWFERITMNRQFINPYYAVVRIDGESIPLPFFFEAREWQLLGGSRNSKVSSHCHLANKLPKWVRIWVDRWSTPVKAC